LAAVLMHLVQAFTLAPSVFIHWRLGWRRLMEARIEWERLIVRE